MRSFVGYSVEYGILAKKVVISVLQELLPSISEERE